MLSSIELVCIAAAAAGVMAPQERPAPLLAFEQARKSIASGRIEWTVLPGGIEDAGLFFVSRYAANGDLIFEVRGDKDGWTEFDWQTGKGIRRYPHLYLINRDGVWHHLESGLSCKWWKREEGRSSPWDNRIRDVRALGVYPTSSSLDYAKGLASMWGRGDDTVVEWSQIEDGGVHIVTGHFASGVRMTWYINPERGWNTERIEYDTGYGLWETVSSLREFDGEWFPGETRYYQDGRLVETIIVRSASLNRSDDPKEFTATDLGVEPGSSVAAQNLPPKSGKELRTWNGDGIVSFEKWLEDVQAGRREWGPRHKRTHESGFESPYDTPVERARRDLARRQANVRYVLARHVGLWERYVRDFIRRYELNDEQTQRAWAMFLDCRRRADAILERGADKLVALVSEYLAAREAADHEKVEKLSKRIADLRGPVDRIFEESLKPRLERLPTRAQRRKVETQDGSIDRGGAPESSSADNP